ncbi:MULTISPECIES: universal stress protein [Salinibaculum]|uniref:universal stress protein n=1 Tax=Salinibaculum TaxID=2732368 RepID=UPI0030D261A7
MYDRILLPTDGSPGTVAAAEHAGALAKAFDGTVHVLSVADTRNRFESPTSGLAPGIWLSGERERAGEAIEQAVAALPDDVAIERVQREGLPRSEIVDYAEEAGVDVVVMGTHGRTGIDHYLLGSVAERVVRTCPVPVVTVPIEDEE